MTAGRWDEKTARLWAALWDQMAEHWAEQMAVARVASKAV